MHASVAFPSHPSLVEDPPVAAACLSRRGSESEAQGHCVEDVQEWPGLARTFEGPSGGLKVELEFSRWFFGEGWQVSTETYALDIRVVDDLPTDQWTLPSSVRVLAKDPEISEVADSPQEDSEPSVEGAVEGAPIDDEAACA
uniref:ATP-dependent RNA helicase mak5 (EC) n=1 Tax=Ganoderma boninense TaxID=34458 RepID=A0A5K1JW05_9APHY|nr:ATP-dependent RNA helicase mak5 (EC [Ganoderma boninense]